MKTGILIILSVLLVVGCKGEDSSSSPHLVEKPNVPQEPESPVEEPVGVPQLPEVEDWAHLSWVPPLTRENGEPISMGEIDGYVILYGPSPDAMTAIVPIEGGNVREHKIEGLEDGTWYFAIKVVDTDGLESSMSDVVTKIIYNPAPEE